MDNFQSQMLKELNNNFNDFKVDIKTDIALIKKDTDKIPAIEKRILSMDKQVVTFENWQKDINAKVEKIKIPKSTINIDAREVKPWDINRVKVWAINIGVGLAGAITVLASFGETAKEFINK